MWSNFTSLDQAGPNRANICQSIKWDQMGLNGAKQRQMGPNGAKWGQTGLNEVKQGQTRPNGSKQGKTGSFYKPIFALKLSDLASSFLVPWKLNSYITWPFILYLFEISEIEIKIVEVVQELKRCSDEFHLK